MFSSFLPSLKLPFARTSPTSDSNQISLAPVRIHDTETDTTSSASSVTDKKRLRRLKHLLKLNHANHAILFNHRQFHNHLPHLLGSAYILGADAEHLNDVYDSESQSGLVPWEDSPGEVSRDDWRAYLGKREYERGFVDFFEDEVVRAGYDWKAVVRRYLFEGEGGEEGPMVNNVVMAGLGHPVIHLGYAYELNSREVAMEALGLAATNYNTWHRYLDDPQYSRRDSKYKTSDPFEVLERVRADERLDGVFTAPGGRNMNDVFGKYESVVLEHWNAWKISSSSTDAKRQFEQTQQVAVALLISAAARQQESSSPSSSEGKEETQNDAEAKYDFFLLHLLTTSHAIRILLPLIPTPHHIPLLRQWFLLALALYISQLRPRIDINKDILHHNTPPEQQTWDSIVHQALTGKHALDAHYVKGIRAMKEAAETWGDDDAFYLKAVARFAGEFAGWGGFSAEEEEDAMQ